MNDLHGVFEALLLLVAPERTSSLVLPMDVHDFEERGPWQEQLRLVSRLGALKARPSWGVQARGFLVRLPVDQLDGAIWRGKGISAGVDWCGLAFGLTVTSLHVLGSEPVAGALACDLTGAASGGIPGAGSLATASVGHRLRCSRSGRSELAIRGDRLTAETRNPRWGLVFKTRSSSGRVLAGFHTHFFPPLGLSNPGWADLRGSCCTGDLRAVVRSYPISRIPGVSLRESPQCGHRGG